MTEIFFGNFTVEKAVIQKFFELLAALVGECRLHITKDGVHVRAVDNQNVAMVEVDLVNFITFDYEHDQETTLGLDVEQIFGALKVIDLPHPVTVSWHMEGDQKVLKFASDRYVMTFNAVDECTIQKDPTPPTLKFNSTFTSHGPKLLEGIRLAEAISERCFIEANQGSCILEGTGEKSSYKYEIGSGASAPARSKYSLDYLKDITKALGDARITI